MFNTQRLVIVTGAASGLGQAVCLAHVSQGISFTGLDWQPGPASIRLDYSLCDVTSQEQVQQALDVAKQRWGLPRIGVNCADIDRSARVLGRSGVHDFELFVTLCLGVFHTPMVDEQVSDRILDSLLTNAALPRWAGEPGEFTEMVLAVVRNRMFNGESIRLDDGLRMPVQ